MIACFDVHYQQDTATVAAILFENWSDSEFVDQSVLQIDGVGDYEPGKFYQRELRPLLSLIAKISAPIDTYVVDAYCHLDASGTPGLGAYLHQQLPINSTVVGVAKNRFRETNHAQEVLRGESSRPLFVTAIGVSNPVAGDWLRIMDGKHRIPTLLKRVDQLCRTGAPLP